MHYKTDATRIIKNVPRMKVWDSVQGKAKRALLLPSTELLDVKQGLEMGKIDHDTYILAFECVRDRAKKIYSDLKAMGFKNVDVIADTVQHYFRHKNQHVWGAHKPFDVVFLDFCGELTEDIHEFISIHLNKFVIQNGNGLVAKDGVLAFTHSFICRKNLLYKNRPAYRKDSFKYPADTLINPNLALEKAAWTCDKALEAMGLKCSALETYVVYNDTGVSMVYFSIKPFSKRKERSDKIRQYQQGHKTTPVYSGPLTTGQRAWRTRNLNKLQKQYAAATSAGVKAAIKRQINKLA